MFCQVLELGARGVDFVLLDIELSELAVRLQVSAVDLNRAAQELLLGGCIAARRVHAGRKRQKRRTWGARQPGVDAGARGCEVAFPEIDGNETGYGLDRVQ